MTDEPQLDRFREAVEEKKREANEASEHPEQPSPGGPEQASDQQDLYTAGRPQDVMSPRDKSAGKGKKTADKWNQ
jgi:hypothetical protein